MKRARLLAYYLPQYHPIPENDEWWGKGFTEWTNVAKAKPLFKGHYQPHLPADLGFYDLRVPEVREAQAKMAETHGVEGFCYYHYWFGGGRMLLERPFNEVLASGKPDFPFCLCWANEDWSGIWYGGKDLLMEQCYPGMDDYLRHFDYLLPAFIDDRYIKVDDKPVFQILSPQNLPDSKQVTDILRQLAHKNGLKGLFLIAGYRCPEGWNPTEHGFDAVVSSKFSQSLLKSSLSVNSLARRILDSRIFVNKEKMHQIMKRFYRVRSYAELIKNMKLTEDYPFELYPSVIPNWDNTPRSGTAGFVVYGATPKLFEQHLKDAVSYVQRYADEHKIVFIKSWNEWAEGNYLEPDSIFGTQYLEAIKSCVKL